MQREDGSLTHTWFWLPVQVVSVIVALIFGSVFHHQPYNTEATVWGRVGLIYLSTTFIGIVNMVRITALIMA